MTPQFGGISRIEPGAKSICIVYGVSEEQALRQCGFKNIIWIPFGSLPMDVDQMISGAYELFDSLSDIYVSVQAPALEAELLRRLDPGRTRRIICPKSYLNLDQVLNGAQDGLPALGKHVLRRIVAEAKPMPVEGVYEPDQFLDSLMDLYDQGLPPGHSLGFNGLTTEHGKEIYTIATPSLNVFTGYYGSGKSEFIENIEIIMAQNEGWKWGIFNPETQPPALALANLVEKLTKMPFGKEIHFDEYGKPRPRLPKDLLLEAHKFVQNHFRFMLPQEKNFTVDNIIDMSSSLVKNFGVKGIVVDPFNMIEYNKPPQMREDIYIGQCLLKLNALKRKHGLWVGVAAHPKTPQANKDGSYPVPSIMALAGGVIFGNMIDFGISVHRNKLDISEPVQIHIQKVKFKHWGRLEMGLLDFDLATSRYRDAKDLNGNTIFAGFDLRKLKQK